MDVVCIPDDPGSPSFTAYGYAPTIQWIDGGVLIIENQDDLKFWDGTGWPTTMIGLQAVAGFWPVGDEWAFVATDAAHGRELWLTDGTMAGTRVIDLEPGPADSDPFVAAVARRWPATGRAAVPFPDDRFSDNVALGP